MARPTRLRLVAVVAGALVAVAACAGEAERSPLALDRASTTTTTTAAPSTTAPSTTAAPSTTTTAAPVDITALRPPPFPADPAALVQQLVAAEETIRDPAAPEPAVAAAALAQQVAYRQLGTHPEWDAAVLAAVPEELRRPVELNAAARREFRAMHTRLPTTMPAWQIVAPARADELLAAYQSGQDAFGIPWQYLAAINLVETGIGRIRGTSTAGAQGPMQFMPATWEAYGGGGDINDTGDAIMGAARYLAANGGASDIGNALYHYNHSDHYVQGVRLYADLIAEHPRAFLAYYHWGIWYVTDHGDIYLPVGYAEPAPVPVADYLARG
jgi:membrane-bound lytic murein transglycosylase B